MDMNVNMLAERIRLKELDIIAIVKSHITIPIKIALLYKRSWFVSYIVTVFARTEP